MPSLAISQVCGDHNCDNDDNSNNNNSNNNNNDDDDDNKSNLLRIWQSLAISQVGHHWQVDPSPPFPFGNFTIGPEKNIAVSFWQILFTIFQCGILLCYLLVAGGVKVHPRQLCLRRLVRVSLQMGKFGLKVRDWFSSFKTLCQMRQN